MAISDDPTVAALLRAWIQEPMDTAIPLALHDRYIDLGEPGAAQGVTELAGVVRRVAEYYERHHVRKLEKP